MATESNEGIFYAVNGLILNIRKGEKPGEVTVGVESEEGGETILVQQDPNNTKRIKFFKKEKPRFKLVKKGE